MEADLRGNLSCLKCLTDEFMSFQRKYAHVASTSKLEGIAESLRRERVSKYTHDEKVKEIRRELGLRTNVYAKMVAAGTLNCDLADYRISILRAILVDYERNDGHLNQMDLGFMAENNEM